LLGAAALAGQPLDGLLVLGALAELALGLLLLERRVADLADVDRGATALAGLALMLAVMAGFVFEIAQGHSAAPYSWLAALGASVYLVAILFRRRRR
jgi:hypothetical protein